MNPFLFLQHSITVKEKLKTSRTVDFVAGFFKFERTETDKHISLMLQSLLQNELRDNDR